MLLCQAVDYHDTMYENIYRLPQGCTLTISKGKKKIERYWYPEKIEINYDISEEEAARKLREIFAKTVSNCVSSLEETAFEVSGGLDSSSVAAVLAQKNETSVLDSYSMNFNGLDCDEGEYMDALIEKYPLNHKKIPVSQLDYSNRYSLDFLYSLSPNWPITLTFSMYLPMLEQMKRDGKKVVLTGQGGDHLFSGTPLMMHDLFRKGRLLALWKELQVYKRPLNVFKSYVLKPFLGEKAVHFIKKCMGNSVHGELQKYNCNKMNISHTLGIKKLTLLNDFDSVTTAAHATVMDGNLFHCAEKYFGITYHHPFFNKELVEFSLSIPSNMKYRNGKIKWIWRKAMEGILPDKINRRKDKAEFSELIMQQIDVLDLDELLSESYIVKLGIIEQEIIDKQVKDYLNKNVKYCGFLWTIINVEYWYRYNQFEAQKREGEKPQ